MTRTGTVTAIELDGEAKDERDRKSGWIAVGTRCKIETDDGEVLWARVMTFGLATVGEWFQRDRIRVRLDECGAWNVYDDATKEEQ
ncbi:MAG: hypothetical protein OXF79_20270 [Chloroflexi bacterium]|nr:hypothetical protein [Chloroflexota bacterium]